MSTDQQWDIVSGIGITALAVAAARAVETSRPDALIQDPYAVRFVEEARPPVPMPTTAAEAEADGARRYWPDTSTYIAVRTRAFDDFFQEAVAAGVTQAVVLAAGLDARAFRLPWPAGTVVYEIDQPLVLDFKLRVLREQGVAASCEHRPVAVDLRNDWATALEAAGFDRSRPTAWLAEGLLPYLPPEAEEELFQEIHRLSTPGSRFAVETFGNAWVVTRSEEAAEGSVRSLGVDITSLIHTDQRPKPADRLTELGWRTRSVPAEEAAAAHGRPLSEEFAKREAVHVFAELS
ncbi:SAM-dependent methyltransferase [Streptomyces sp. NPDC001404]|uniref:SAM-dependent methyltransferase n=1 Tax=Streptomyces sp. NPDC001404 TaxID=3364571 RepID=UPI0036C544A3